MSRAVWARADGSSGFLVGFRVGFLVGVSLSTAKNGVPFKQRLGVLGWSTGQAVMAAAAPKGPLVARGPTGSGPAGLQRFYAPVDCRAVDGTRRTPMVGNRIISETGCQRNAAFKHLGINSH